MTFRVRNAIRSWLWICTFVVAAALSFAPRVNAQTLRNADVIKMVQAKLGDAVIISEIKNSNCNFDTSPNALIKLKEDGVSDKVLEAMTKAGRTESREPVASQSPKLNASIPVPENYGIYAAANGKLLGIDVPVSTMTPPRVVVRLWDGGSVSERQIPMLPSDVSFVQFGDNDEILPDELFVSRYVRDVRTLANESPQDAWVDTRIIEPYVAPIPLLERPMSGHPGVTIFSPARRLSPGVYFVTTIVKQQVFVFAVGQPAVAARSHCFDFSVSRLVPCTGVPAPPQPSASVPSAPGNSGVPRRKPLPIGAKCGDYTTCLAKGNAALKGYEWPQALTDFRAASTMDASRPDAWAGQGFADLPLQRYGDLAPAWNNALARGGTIDLRVWHLQGLHYKPGNLQISAKQVSFSDPDQKASFSVPPSQVTSLEAQMYGSVEWWVHMRVGGRNNNFVYMPLGFSCDKPLDRVCRGGLAVAQEEAVAKYVAETIPKLASGALSAAERPLSEAPNPAVEIVTLKAPGTPAPAARGRTTRPLQAYLGTINDDVRVAISISAMPVINEQHADQQRESHEGI